MSAPVVDAPRVGVTVAAPNVTPVAVMLCDVCVAVDSDIESDVTTMSPDVIPGSLEPVMLHAVVLVVCCPLTAWTAYVPVALRNAEMDAI